MGNHDGVVLHRNMPKERRRLHHDKWLGSGQGRPCQPRQGSGEPSGLGCGSPVMKPQSHPLVTKSRRKSAADSTTTSG